MIISGLSILISFQFFAFASKGIHVKGDDGNGVYCNFNACCMTFRSRLALARHHHCLKFVCQHVARTVLNVDGGGGGYVRRDGEAAIHRKWFVGDSEQQHVLWWLCLLLHCDSDPLKEKATQI